MKAFRIFRDDLYYDIVKGFKADEVRETLITKFTTIFSNSE